VPKTIADVHQNGKAGDQVLFKGVVVLGVRKLVGSSNGYYLSDETQGPWHCIFVHTGSTVSTLVAGDRVDVSGAYAEYNGLNQLSNGATVTLISHGAALPELDVTIDQLTGASAEAYESCRVRVQNVTGITLGTGVGLEQGGKQIRANNFIWAGTTFVTAGGVYQSVKGFAGYFSSAREILPQVDADIVK
jgi:predicted extracellular nuclease